MHHLLPLSANGLFFSILKTKIDYSLAKFPGPLYSLEVKENEIIPFSEIIDVPLICSTQRFSEEKAMKSYDLPFSCRQSVELLMSQGLQMFALLYLLYVSYTVSYTFLVS